MKKHRTAEEMQAVLANQASSGLSKKAYCEAHDLDPAVFYYWQRRLRASSIEEIGFTPVKVSKSYEVEVDVGQGNWIGLRSTSMETLIHLVKQLGSSHA